MKNYTSVEGARKALDWLRSERQLPEKVDAALDRLDFDTVNFFDKLETPRLCELYWAIEKLRSGPKERRDNKRIAELLKEFARIRLDKPQ